MDRALLVGINAYGGANTLRGCINDVNDVKAFITANCNFAADAVTLLLDADATAANIKQSLRTTVNGLANGDRLLFWYSGHGAQLTDGDIATDVICPVDFDFTADKSVTVQDFHDIFSALPAGVDAVWCSDSCHSGDLEGKPSANAAPADAGAAPADAGNADAGKGMARSFIGPNGPQAHVAGRAFREISDSMPNIALISGCQSDQTSADATFNDRPNGAFTYYMLQCLNAQGGLQAALTALVPQVVAALHNNQYDQVPELSGPTAEVNLSFLGGGAQQQPQQQQTPADGGTPDAGANGSTDGGSSAAGAGPADGN